MRRASNSVWSRKSEGAKPQARPCDQPGCPHGGEYRAPRSRTDLNSYYWFCLEHVRAYNAAWDFYAGMSADEIERAVRADITWERPTWPLGARVGGRGFSLDEEQVQVHDPFGFFQGEAGQQPQPRRRAETAEEKALRTLELQGPVTADAVKARYKALVKIHHPDRNGGDKAAEERFKEIGQAYKVLMDSLNV
jgi:hypothetical protein